MMRAGDNDQQINYKWPNSVDPYVRKCLNFGSWGKFPREKGFVNIKTSSFFKVFKLLKIPKI